MSCWQTEGDVIEFFLVSDWLTGQIFSPLIGWLLSVGFKGAKRELRELDV